MGQLVLSLFPSIGLLDRAFEDEGFTVVRGPDVLWGGDVRRFHPPAGKFDGVIGGPPCQSFSSLAHLVRAQGREPRFGNLIPEYERCVVEAGPAWFLMEEVRAAPVPVVPGYATRDFLLDNCWLLGEDGLGQEQERLRRFTFGVRGPGPAPNLLRWIDLAALLLPEGDRSGGHGRSRSRTVTALGPQHLDGLSKGTQKYRHETLTGGNDRPPGVRDKAAVRRPAVISSDGGKSVRMARYTLTDACRLQGLPEDFFKDTPFRKDAALKMVANGVPYYMGRAVARAVREATEG